MSMKYFFLLLGTLLLVQCVHSDSSEESKDNSDSKDSSEEKIDENQLKRHVLKTYLKLLDKAVASTKKAYQTVLNELETNKGTTNPKVQEKLTELKTVLEKANTKTTTISNLDVEKHNKNNLLNEITQITKDLEKLEDETTTPTEQDTQVRKAHETLLKDLQKNVNTFADKTVKETEKYWKGLSTTEQKEKQNLQDALTDVKNEATAPKKLELLDKVFVLSADNVANAVTW